jgi:hypothetical protein
MSQFDTILLCVLAGLIALGALAFALYRIDKAEKRRSAQSDTSGATTTSGIRSEWIRSRAASVFEDPDDTLGLASIVIVTDALGNGVPGIAESAEDLALKGVDVS